jgi:hypothetical protein
MFELYDICTSSPLTSRRVTCRHGTTLDATYAQTLCCRTRRNLIWNDASDRFVHQGQRYHTEHLAISRLDANCLVRKSGKLAEFLESNNNPIMAEPGYTILLGTRGDVDLRRLYERWMAADISVTGIVWQSNASKRKAELLIISEAGVPVPW